MLTTWTPTPLAIAEVVKTLRGEVRYRYHHEYELRSAAEEVIFEAGNPHEVLMETLLVLARSRLAKRERRAASLYRHRCQCAGDDILPCGTCEVCGRVHTKGGTDGYEH